MWRHDSVLKTIASHLQSMLTPLNASLYVTIPGYMNPSEIFEAARPDLLVVVATASQLYNLLVVSNLT